MLCVTRTLKTICQKIDKLMTFFSNKVICSKLLCLEVATFCLAYLDQGSEMIIFESVLTTLLTSDIFRGPGVAAKNGTCLKPNQLSSIGETHCMYEGFR